MNANVCKISVLLLLLAIVETNSATIKDILKLNSPDSGRVQRDAQYYNRYGSAAGGQDGLPRALKPEESAEARENDKENPNVEKRCTRCDYYANRDYKYPYESRAPYDDRYDDRYSRDRYRDDKYERPRYYEDYDRRQYDGDRKYDPDRRYDDRDRYDTRYDRDRYDRRYETDDRYNRDRYDKDDRTRYYDRNYDRYDRGYRPWDETTRGTSGFDSTGRGYYFAVGRPDYGTSGSGYASGWQYGGGAGGGSGGRRDTYNRDSDRNWRDQG